MSNNRIEKIIHRHEEKAIKKWLWWANAVLMVVSAALTIYFVSKVFTAELFLLDAVNLVVKIFVPLFMFGFWSMSAHLLALNSSPKMIWLVSSALGLTSFLFFAPVFALIAFALLTFANAQFMLAMRGEYHLRIKISPSQNIERGIHIFLNLAFLLMSLGVFIFYSFELEKKGFRIPEVLLEREVEAVLNFAGVPIDLKPETTFGEVNQRVAEKVTEPSVRDQLKREGISEEEINRVLAEKRQEILAETKNQFFGKLGIVGNDDERFLAVVEKSWIDLIKKNLPFPINIAVPAIFAIGLFLLLRGFSFLFIWIGQGFAWAWFHLTLILHLIKIERRAEDVELVRF